MIIFISNSVIRRFNQHPRRSPPEQFSLRIGAAANVLVLIGLRGIAVRECEIDPRPSVRIP
jgi:hypothetical protein